MSKEAGDGRFVAEIGMAMAVERLLRAGYHVARPVVDDGYDLIAYVGRRHWRIQVKATGSVRSNGCRIRVRRGNRRATPYSPKHVDAFVLVQTTTRTVLCIPVAHVRGSWARFRKNARYTDFGILRSIAN